MISDEAIRRTGDLVQVFNIFLASAILTLTIGMGWRWPRLRPYLVISGTYAVHSLVFYAVVLTISIGGPWTSLWSAVLRTHSYLFIVSMLIVVALAARWPIWRDYDVDLPKKAEPRHDLE